MKIKLMNMYVDDQEKALRFYTEKLGFKKKADFSKGDFRWLTVVASDDPEGVELVLQRAMMPAAKGLQDAGQSAANFYVDDVAKEHDRLAALDVKFTMPPTKVTGSTIAILDDTCGNLIQLTKLEAWAG